MEKKQVLLTDLDGVSVDWLSGFAKFMELELGHKAEHLNPLNFTMIDIFPNLEKPYVHVRDYQHTDYYKNAPAYVGAYESYKVLKDMGVNIVAVTSCGTDKKIKENRIYNLESNFPNIFDEVHMLEIGEDKSKILSNYRSSKFIDDQIANVIAGSKTGHESYLWDMSYNTKEVLPEKAFRMKNWDALIENYRNELKLPFFKNKRKFKF
jgi:hypothetical protein